MEVQESCFWGKKRLDALKRARGQVRFTHITTPQGGTALAKRERLSLRFSREGSEHVKALSRTSRAACCQKDLLGSPSLHNTEVCRVAGSRERLGELLPGLSDGTRNTRPLTDSLSGRCPRAAGGSSPADLPSCPQTRLPCCMHRPCMPPPSASSLYLPPVAAC